MRNLFNINKENIPEKNGFSPQCKTSHSKINKHLSKCKTNYEWTYFLRLIVWTTVNKKYTLRLHSIRDYRAHATELKNCCCRSILWMRNTHRQFPLRSVTYLQSSHALMTFEPLLRTDSSSQSGQQNTKLMHFLYTYTSLDGSYFTCTDWWALNCIISRFIYNIELKKCSTYWSTYTFYCSCLFPCHAQERCSTVVIIWSSQRLKQILCLFTLSI